jgi:hypothetical protein
MEFGNKFPPLNTEWPCRYTTDHHCGVRAHVIDERQINFVRAYMKG